MAFELITRLTATEFSDSNPTLLLNELGVETDVRNEVNQGSGKAKLGDDFTEWNDLPYWNPSGTGVIGGDTGATAGSLLFAGVSGVLAQDNPHLFWDNTNDILKLLDSSYSPLLGAKTFSTIGSSTAINNSGHFLGTIYDVKLNQTGTGHDIEGTYLNLNVAGTHTNDFMLGSFISLSNVGDTGATNHLTGVEVFTNIERTAADGYGIDILSALGGSGASGTGKVVGIRSIAGVGHGASTPLAVAGHFEIDSQGNGAGTADLTHLLKLVYTNQATETLTDARGISLTGWTNLGTITTSYGIYMDTSIDVGATKFALYSLSTSPSVLSGNLTINGTGKFFITTPQTPANSSATGTTGQIVWDSGFLYACVGTNSWRRVATSTF